MSSVYSPEVIVLFVIMGAAAACLVAYAMARFFVKDFFNPTFECSPEQGQYMREVRERNKAWAWEDATGQNDRVNGREGQNSKRVSAGPSGGGSTA